MEYINKKTGAICNFESEMKGAWEPVKAPAPKKKAPKKATVKKSEE